MFQTWRLTLREAEEAYKQGQFEQAAGLLQSRELQSSLPGQRLAARVAEGLADRALRTLRQGDFSTAWRDLEASLAIGGRTDHFRAVRTAMIEQSLDRVEQSLRVGDFDRALRLIDLLSRRKVESEQLADLVQVTRRLQSARHLQRHGQFAEAEAQLEGAARLRPRFGFLQESLLECRERAGVARQLSQQLHEQVSQGEWTRVVALAEQMLALAPQWKLPEQLRRKAWSEVGGAGVHTAAAAVGAGADTQYWGGDTVSEPRTAEPLGRRFVLWVDAVGGYLVCLDREVHLGQAAAGEPAHVPLLADLKRRHATLRREEDRYLLVPHGPLRLDGRPVTGSMLLASGQTLELGDGVKFRFHQPHPLSATATLERLSRHRIEPYVDGVLLMAESCVLGPQGRSHVVCRPWRGEITLHRREEGLFCRSSQEMEIDGRWCEGRGMLGWNSRAAGSDFSFSLEELA